MRSLHRATELVISGEAAFTLRAWLAAPWVVLALAQLGLEPTLRGIERAPRRLFPSGFGVEAGERAVGRAFRFHPWLDDRCLPRALVQYLLHRRDGTPARFVIGVRRPKESLDAHAWVERPGGESASDYAPILTAELS